MAHADALRAAFDALPGSPSSAGARMVRPNADAWAERWRLVSSAERSVDVSYFIIEGDVFGLSFLALLLRKAREGVRVRLLLDGRGLHASNGAIEPALAALHAQETAEVRIFRPLREAVPDALKTLEPLRLAASNHHKIILVDEEAGMLGGRNIASAYLVDADDDARAFRDTDVVTQGRHAARALLDAIELHYEDALPYEGAIAAERSSDDLLLLAALMEEWLLAPSFSAAPLEELGALPRTGGALLRPRPELHDAEVLVLASRARLGTAQDDVTQGLLRLTEAASDELLIENPYQLWTDRGIAALEGASSRGVALAIYTSSPASADNALTQALFLEQWPELLARVSGLRLFAAADERNVHSKVAVFDGRLTVIGTYNLDPFSYAVNGEVVALVWSEAFAAAARELFWKNARAPRTVEYRVRRSACGEAYRHLPGHRRAGEAIVDVGPSDHVDPDAWPAVGVLRSVVRSLRQIRGAPWPIYLPPIERRRRRARPPGEDPRLGACHGAVKRSGLTRR